MAARVHQVVKAGWGHPTVDAEVDEGYRGLANEFPALRFLPRLNPLARAVTLTFSGAGEQVTLELQLP